MKHFSKVLLLVFAASMAHAESKKSSGSASNKRGFVGPVAESARIDAKAGKLIVTVRVNSCNSPFGELHYIGSNKAKWGSHHYAVNMTAKTMNCPLPKSKTVQMQLDLPEGRVAGDKVTIRIGKRRFGYTVRTPLEDENLALLNSSEGKSKSNSVVESKTDASDLIAGGAR